MPFQLLSTIQHPTHTLFKMKMIPIIVLLLISTRKYQQSYGFTLSPLSTRLIQPPFIVSVTTDVPQTSKSFSNLSPTRYTIQLHSALPQQEDLDVIRLVVGQENYGLAVVCVGEALWSFLSAPSVDHIKVLIPAAVAAAVLVLVSGPMITSGDVDSIGTGLWIATAASTGLGVSYLARMIAPYSPSPKEIAGLGLLVAVAGFFSFAQNLLVDGFVILPSLPTIELPDFSSIVDTTTTVDVQDVVSTSPVIDAQPLPIELPVPAPELNLDHAVSNSVSDTSEVLQ